MARWHHWLDGPESEWTPGVGDGQGGLACCDSWGRKESDTTERLNWTEAHRRMEQWIQIPKSFPGGSVGKESTWNMGDLSSVPGVVRALGEGNSYPLQYSGLENSMDYSTGLQRVRHNWAHFTHSQRGQTKKGVMPLWRYHVQEVHLSSNHNQRYVRARSNPHKPQRQVLSPCHRWKQLRLRETRYFPQGCLSHS